MTDAPLLGTIAKHTMLHGTGHERLVVQALPTSDAAEDYRIMGTKLAFSNRDRTLRSVVISSLQANEDISEITANLAVALVQTGKRIILVDAYLHRPTIDQLLGIASQFGLANMLAEQSEAPELIAVDWAPGLSILPSGEVPSNPLELLASNHMLELIKTLENRADIVIIAASPLLAFADSLILASRVDGVVVATHRGETRRDMVRDAVESLRSLNAYIIGTVLDDNPGREWGSMQAKKRAKNCSTPA